MRAKIRIETGKDAYEFCAIATKLPGRITVHDGSGLVVNAKSVLGMLYTMEFDELWCESENDIYSHISKFVVEE